MAFKNAKAALTTSATTIYTCPSGHSAAVLLCQLANASEEDDVTIHLTWTDASDSNAATTLIWVSLPVHSAISGIDGKLVLESGDAIKALADIDAVAHVSCSIMEMAI